MQYYCFGDVFDATRSHMALIVRLLSPAPAENYCRRRRNQSLLRVVHKDRRHNSIV